MFLSKSPLLISMIVNSILVFLLFTTKPMFLFDKDGKTIPFGIGNDRSIFSMTTIIILSTTCLTLFTNLLIK